MARLAIASMEASLATEGPDDGEVPWSPPPFPPDLLIKLPLPVQRATAKQLVRAIGEMQVVQMAGGAMHGKLIGEILLDSVSHIVLDEFDVLHLASTPQLVLIDPIEGPRTPEFLLGRLKPLLTAFLGTLHLPVDAALPEQRGDFVAAWLGVFPGVDPSLLLDEFGLEYSLILLQLRQLYPKTTDIARIVDMHAWLASLAQQPLNVSLPALSDMIAFRAEPSWSAVHAGWILTQNDLAFVPPAPATAEMLTDGDDLLYRTLVAQAGKADPTGTRYFRMEPPPMVPTGWTWPAKDPDFIYWWKSILRTHCAEHLMILKDTADFHVADLLRFVHLFELYSPNPDRRIPGYVASCIKAALLHFKYWFDEPPATGHKGGEMTFWSENHQALFHSSQFLVGQLFPNDVFPRSGNTADGQPMTGSEHLTRGRERIERWLNRRLAFGFSEWCSPGYYNEDFPPVLNVVDFSQDEGLATKAAMVVDLLIFDLARNTCRGSFGVSAGRAYFGGKAYGWGQSVGETIEVLFGTRHDHLRGENTAIALCTSPKYVVPEALLAIGRDREILDQIKPIVFRSRVSINIDEASAVGVGFESDADAAFWWGLGAYFAPGTMELTRRIAPLHDNLKTTGPLALLFRFDLFGNYLNALLLDTAEIVAGNIGLLASKLLLVAPPPVNLLAYAVHFASLSLMIEGLVNLLGDLVDMISNAIEAGWAAITGQDPPKPRIPEAALERAWEAMLMTFNGGNVLSRANLYTYSVGDAMLSSAQNHQAQQISFQKQPWMASLGCDACVWTNAPMDPKGSSLIGTSWEVFKHLATAQASRAFGDIAMLAGAGLDEIKDEGLRDWGGSICLPKVVQHRSVTIAAYNFPAQRSEFSATFTHAWFPAEFFDEVTPAPENEDLLPEREGGGTWVFGRRKDGYVALCSARRVKWVRDNRFNDDPDPFSDQTMGQGRFMSTELRAEDGSNIWVCAIGSRAQFGSFQSFAAKVRASYLHLSGIGELGQLQCTFDMPEATGTDEPGFRWELFFSDDQAHLNGAAQEMDNYPR
ncbi:MAG: hypothetical protein ABI877_14545, partial [Gemmatimonadaceae bacterium]